MKYLLSLFITTLIAVFPVLSQKRKTVQSKSTKPAHVEKSSRARKQILDSSDEPPPPVVKPKTSGDKYSSSNAFREVVIGKWNVAGLSTPQDLTGGSDNGESTSRNKDVVWVTYSRYWRHPAPVYPGLLDVELTVTTWNDDFKKIVPDLRSDLATAENMILLDLMGDLRKKNEVGSFVKDARPLEIGGIKGGFFRADYPSHENRFMASWYTYRYFEGRAQRISLNVSGRKSELPKLMKIIESLKLK